MKEQQISTWIQNYGIKELNPLQKTSIQEFRSNTQLILLSQTGSGKTLAFLLPVLSKLDYTIEKSQALILSPARELSLQIESVIKDLKTGCKSLCCYGGHSIQSEQNSLIHPPHIIVGTPGRIADLIRKGSINPETIQHLVLDEFDKALELGFETEMKEILISLKKLKTKILTSATAMDSIPDFVEMKNAKTISFLKELQQNTNLSIEAYRADGRDKLDAFIKLICEIGNEPCIAFVNHREAAERISDHLKRLSIPHDLFHGGLKQEERERALIKFRNGSIQLLLTTDLAARGLDIPDIKYIIHYHLPIDEKSFTHRNGRTARMNASGKVYILLAEDEQIPEIITPTPTVVKFSNDNNIPSLPYWETLFIGYGKKDKINKVDIVGLFLKKAMLKKDELGRIDVLDKISFVAVPRDSVKQILNQLKNEKIKGKKLKISISM